MRAANAMEPARSAVRVLMMVLTSVVCACGVRGAAREELAPLERFEGREIAAVSFANPGPFTADTLADLVETQPSRCYLVGLAICIPFTRIGKEEHRLDLAVLQRDVLRLEAFYRNSGYFGTTVVPVVEPEAGKAGAGRVAVTFVITPGTPVYLVSFDVEGTQGIIAPAELERRLPLHTGELFNLGAFAASADTIRGVLRGRGYAYAEVLRSYDVDTLTDRATAKLVAVSGPLVEVDSILVQGAEHLGRRATLRQLTFSKGDLLLPSELVESQRNLYGLDIVDFATVSLAPDSLQAFPRDSARATVLVQVTEGAVHVVEASIGYGSVDCIFSRVSWVSRSFGGGARRLAVSGAVSKIGIGNPLNAGFGGSICTAFRGDPFANTLDYHFSVDLGQPYFLSPRNSVALSVYAERESQPNVFQTKAEGTRLSVTHRLDPRQFLTASLEVERQRTLASGAVFCIAFLVCRPQDVAALAGNRLINVLGLSWLRNRTDLVTDPTRGHRVTATIDWAAPWLGSEIDFVRGTAEASAYASLGPGRVLALHLRPGTFFDSVSLGPNGNFIPPQYRFYAGGANSVRGFGQNELGPGVYVEEGPQFNPAAVEFVPVGGLSVIVTTLEMRVPTPLMSNNIRLAVFVDAGAVGEERIWRLGGSEWRVTPGVGLRIGTPVGPVRVDVAYNPYAPLTAPLYLIEPETRVLVRVADAFTPERPSFLNRFRVHLAVGEPF